MKVQTFKSVKGNEVHFLTPENEEDMQALRLMEERGELSGKNSFGDWKNSTQEVTCDKR